MTTDGPSTAGLADRWWSTEFALQSIADGVALLERPTDEAVDRSFPDPRIPDRIPDDWPPADVGLATSSRQALFGLLGVRTACAVVERIAEAMHDGVLLLASDGRIVWHNAVATRVLDRNSAALLGSSWVDPSWETVHLDGRHFPMTDHPSMRALRSGTPVLGEVVGIRTGHRTNRWLRIDATPVDVDDARFAIVVFTDVTNEFENERALRSTLDEMQATLIQRVLPLTDRVRFCGSYRSVGMTDSVGGDFFGAYALGPTSHTFFIGDACGHGVGAAGLSSLSRTTLRSVAPYVDDPSTVLRRLHDIVLADWTGQFLTAVHGRLEQSGTATRLTFSSGGHPLPILIRDHQATRLGQFGEIIGMVPNSDRPTTEEWLVPGDRVVMYTDGVVDGSCPRLTDDDLLERIPTNTSIENVVDILSRLPVHREGRQPPDDAAILGFEIR